MMRYLSASVKALDGPDPGSFEAVASTPNIDRDGEVVAPYAFQPLPLTVPVHVDHQMTSEALVGTASPSYDGTGLLRVRGTFAGTPRAQVVRQLVVEGHLARVSVGFFNPRYDRSGDVPKVMAAELLEVSFVTVPSNREALVTSARSYTSSPAERRFASLRTRALLALVETDLLMDDVRRKPSPGDVKRAVADARALLAELSGAPR